jgi:hypothetical protein
MYFFASSGLQSSFFMEADGIVTRGRDGFVDHNPDAIVTRCCLQFGIIFKL